MRVLTIDTATSAAAIGLVIDGVATDGTPVREPAAAQHVLRATDELLSAAGLRMRDIERIVVGRGPGSFTGVRVGLASALGLAAGLAQTPVGVITTSALRHAAGPRAVAVIDARRGEVFVEGPELELQACTPSQLVDLLPAGTLLVGDGAARYRASFAAMSVPDDDSALHVPAAASLAALSSGGGAAAPLYVRAPDAVPTEQR